MSPLPDHLEDAVGAETSGVRTLALPQKTSTWGIGSGWLWILGGAAVFSAGYAFWSFAFPPEPLTTAEQASLKEKGVVWAAPCAPAPASSLDMVQSDGGFHPLGSTDTALQVLGPLRMSRLMDAGWRFWRPKVDLDACVEMAGQQVRAIGA